MEIIFILILLTIWLGIPIIISRKMARHGNGKIGVFGATIITLILGWIGVAIVRLISVE